MIIVTFDELRRIFDHKQKNPKVKYTKKGFKWNEHPMAYYNSVGRLTTVIRIFFRGKK